LGLAAPQTVTQAFGGGGSGGSGGNSGNSVISPNSNNNNNNGFLSNSAPLSPPMHSLQHSSSSSSLTNANIITYGGSNPSPAQMNLLNQLAAQLKVDGPVTSRLFVASIDFRVDDAKLQEVFGMAGQVSHIALFRDRDGKSRGMAVVEYDTPYEALNAVSMFNKQILMDRQMSVRFDVKPPELAALLNEPPPPPELLAVMGGSKGGGGGMMMMMGPPLTPAVVNSKPPLPSGLKSIGSGLSLTSLPPPILNPSLTSTTHYNHHHNNHNNHYGNSLLSNPPLPINVTPNDYSYNSYNANIGSSLNPYNNNNNISNNNGYSNGTSSSKVNSSSSSSNGSLHVRGGGDIRIVSSSGNGSLSISNRIASYSSSSSNNNNNNNNGSSSSGSSSSRHEHTSSSNGRSSSSSNSYSTSKSSSSSSSSSTNHGAKVFVKNVSEIYFRK
jgi:hypothetical protein